MSQTLPRDALLQARAQLNLHAVLALSAVIHQQEVGVVAVQTGEVALALNVHRVMGWKTSLQRERELVEEVKEERRPAVGIIYLPLPQIESACLKRLLIVDSVGE